MWESVSDSGWLGSSWTNVGLIMALIGREGSERGTLRVSGSVSLGKKTRRKVNKETIRVGLD